VILHQELEEKKVTTAKNYKLGKMHSMLDFLTLYFSLFLEKAWLSHLLKKIKKVLDKPLKILYSQGVKEK